MSSVCVWTCPAQRLMFGVKQEDCSTNAVPRRRNCGRRSSSWCGEQPVDRSQQTGDVGRRQLTLAGSTPGGTLEPCRADTCTPELLYCWFYPLCEWHYSPFRHSKWLALITCSDTAENLCLTFNCKKSVCIAVGARWKHNVSDMCLSSKLISWCNRIRYQISFYNRGVKVYWCTDVRVDGYSGAGTNLKVGKGHPVRSKSGWTFFSSCPSIFCLEMYNNYSFWWALSWWSVQFGQFLVCCSSIHGAPRAQPFVNVGGGASVPRAQWSRRHWTDIKVSQDWQCALCRATFELPRNRSRQNG